MLEMLVVVTGLPGSRKTTLARRLARKLNLPLIARTATRRSSSTFSASAT